MNSIDAAINDLDIFHIEGNEMVGMTKKELIEFRNSIKDLLAMKKRADLTELLTTTIKSKYKIYSIRDDDRKELWIYQEGIYVPNGATYIQQFCRIVLENFYTNHMCNEVIDKIRADSYIEHNDFFSVNYPHLVVCENGVLNVLTRELSPFSDEYIFFNKIPVNYDDTKDCVLIKNFLKEILEDNADFLVIQEMFGDLLLGEYKHERCFMFVGEGRNGKSKVGDLIKRFLGVSSVCSVHPSTLEDPDSFTISHFFGKRANVSLDINSTSLKNISVIKSLSGRDVITAQRKFKTPIEFENRALLIFGSNELPRTYDTKTAFWERWILINFPFTFINEDIYKKYSEVPANLKKKDPSIIQKITTESEMSGLLNFALDGLKRLEENKNYSYKYTPEEVRSMWIMKSDSFNAFYFQYLEHSYDSKMRKVDLRKYYADYCRLNKLKPVSDKSISMSLAENGVSDDVSRSEGYEPYWVGVKIKDKFEERDSFNYSRLQDYEKNSKLIFTKSIAEKSLISGGDL